MITAVLALYHNFNSYLDTNNGELLKKAVEFLLLLIINYMLISESKREERKDIRYLLAGFAVLAADKFIMALLWANVVYGTAAGSVLSIPALMAEDLVEIFALVWIGNAFVYRLYEKDEQVFNKKVKIEIGLILLVIVCAALSMLAFNNISEIGSLENRILFAFAESLKIIVLFQPIYLLVKNKILDRYHRKLINVFIVYSITPMLNLVNTIFYAAENPYLIVLAHPFHFIAFALFLRIVFLKLVDKATLKQELEETKALSRMKDEFVSIISHELRTPLTSMKLYLSLLKDKKLGSLNEKQQESVEIISNESTRLSSLIDDVLNLAKLENKKVRLRPERCDLNKMMEKGIYHNLAEQKKIKVLIKIPENFSVHIDPDKFRQVYINLFSNAVKYTDENGKITIGAKKCSSFWKFWIEDNGVGIPKEKIARIFDKFYQVEDDYMKREGIKGTGLGLAIVHKIVELHNGKIGVESEPGKGSRFTVVIPNDLNSPISGRNCEDSLVNI